MSMSRSQLARMIDSGRTSSLDCLTMLKDISAEAVRATEAQTADGNTAPPKIEFFTTSFLNKCIFLKTVEAETNEGSTHYQVRNLLYFPYNASNLYEGGDSVFLADPAFEAKLASKFDGAQKGRAESVIDPADNDLLQLLEAIPTFDPFLLKCKVQQLAIEDRVDPAFFNVDEREWQILQKKIRGKIRALVDRAFGESEDVTSAAIEQQVTIFLNKIWEARDVVGIEDLVNSLGIPHDKAPELFFAWKAICYYQTKYEFLKQSLKDFFAWFGGGSTALPSDFFMLAQDEAESVMRTKRILRQRLRESFREVEGILTDYESGYREFIEDGNPEAFKSFLGNADTLCNRLAGGLAAFAHAINIYRNVTTTWGKRLPQRRHAEVMDSLVNLFGDAAAPGRKSGGADKSGDMLVGITADAPTF